ncbi:hypothetical protein XAP412_1190006 [Xanthomonas phaseoli pv. phaseoli]|uniref:Uncharacterized protein n=1 Tax=Xanthomonas campestris pv. phaseoli TaxID=317013 RepID=A0AB38DV68_XANCH|nr:hypothetical protein XAP6984_1230006 [Xanthomonas phaseoli pv. phaseoli]SON76892.1 hypothetical protein XAP412_1190006 [Xanthomonas phaseoli pv. phaseoli]SON81826.1 hypothetical protein XAP7430_1200006 [Xanthomonas phaseoli pv. phaseoli]SOO31046.1 hypothetical protein XAP6164_4960007 [Xanthomonas phaseoli pv. phaseoli]
MPNNNASQISRGGNPKCDCGLRESGNAVTFVGETTTPDSEFKCKLADLTDSSAVHAWPD